MCGSLTSHVFLSVMDIGHFLENPPQLPPQKMWHHWLICFSRLTSCGYNILLEIISPFTKAKIFFQSFFCTYRRYIKLLPTGTYFYLTFKELNKVRGFLLEELSVILSRNWTPVLFLVKAIHNLRRHTNPQLSEMSTLSGYLRSFRLGIVLLRI